MSGRQVACDEAQATKSRENSLRQAPARRVESTPECRVCFGVHDDAIHAASVRVRLWHRFMVTQYLEAYPYSSPGCPS